VNRFLVSALLVLTVTPAFAQGAATAPVSARRLLVMPFENVNREARLYWLQEAAAILLADALNERGANALTRAQRVRAFEQLHVPPNAALSHATMIKVGHLVAASDVIFGTLRLDREELSVRARVIGIDTGRLQPEIAERGPLDDLFAIFDRLAARLNPSGGASGGSRRAPPPSLAFEHYVKGLLAEQAPTRLKYLQRALELAPDYDRTRLALWEVYTDQDNHAQALAAARAVAEASPRRRRGQFLAALSQIELKQYDEAFATLKVLNDAQPAAALYNNLGVVQLLRGATSQSGRSAYYFTKAADLDKDDADYCFNAGYAYLLERDMPAAQYWLRETVRRNPVDGDAHFALGAALYATGAVPEAAREKALARQLSSKYDDWEKRAAGELMPRGLARLKDDFDVPRALRLDAAIVNTAQREQRELAAFHLDQGRKFFEQQRDREADAELRRSLYLSPYQGEAHLLLGRLYLRAGRVRDAADSLKVAIWCDPELSEAKALLDKIGAP
jgi:tetratricopeptide (TPR) repeat protein